MRRLPNRAHVVPDPPGVEQAATGRYYVAHTGTGALPCRLAPEGDAKMPACGREGGGGVVAQRLAVMGSTRSRSARVSRPNDKTTDGVRKADDGRQPEALLVRRTIGDDESALAQYV